MTDCCFDNPLEQGIFWVDRLFMEQPQCAAVLLGDFLFLQGKAAPSFLKAGSCQKRLAADGRAGLGCAVQKKAL